MVGVGYIEDLELISVADILQEVSLNNTSTPQPTNAGNLTPSGSQRFNSDDYNRDMPPYENVQNFDVTERDYLLRIPNPIGYLQELCVKKGLGLPVYDIVKTNGPPHEPSFSASCRLQDHYRVVTSKSKKQGKEMVAREIIICVKFAIDAEPKIKSETVQDSTIEIKPEMSSARAIRAVNYVGFLQELCVRKQLPPPHYGEDKSTGTANNPSFYIFCEVGPYREVGTSGNKKGAKQMAAEKILEHLHTNETNTDPSYKERTNAENNEILQSSTTNLTTKDMQVLSEPSLKTFTIIPNPIGHLQELCVKYRLRPPIYEIVKMDGPPHMPTFTTLCTVENWCQEAISNNKKKGREIAASKILNLMKQRTAMASIEWKDEGETSEDRNEK